MVLTREQLISIGQIKPVTADIFLPLINEHVGEVNTRLRMAAWLANVLHESLKFYYLQEIASGAKYEGRKDLGNVVPGDGKKFKGRGLIQITGRANYMELSHDWYGDERLLDTPELLATPDLAVRSAFWFWNKRHLNELADAGDFKEIVKRINGGYNHMLEREVYYERALTVLG